MIDTKQALSGMALEDLQRRLADWEQNELAAFLASLR